MGDVPSGYTIGTASFNKIAAIPAAWDAAQPLDGRIGEYVDAARKKGRIIR